MPEKFKPTDPTSTIGNLQAKPEFDLSEYAQSLLTDESLLSGIPEEERGKAITDRVLGAIIANGKIKGSRKEYTPKEIISGVDAIGQDYNNVDMIPRAAGARKTAMLLASDVQTGQFIGKLTERSGLGQYEPKGLASLDMLEGYLDAIEDKAPDGVQTASYEWRKAIIGAVERYASSTYASRWDEERDMAGSDNDYLRQQGNVFANALESARRIGVDFTLVQDTADKLRQYTQQKRDIGRAGLRSFNYSNLFE